MADRWRDCLSTDPSCENPNIPPPPGGQPSPPPSQTGLPQPPQTSFNSTRGGRTSTGYNPDNDTEPTVTEAEETDASYVIEELILISSVPDLVFNFPFRQLKKKQATQVKSTELKYRMLRLT